MYGKTLILIKPDHVELADDILKELDCHGYRVKTARVDAVPRDVIEDHYSPHNGKWFFESMTESFVGRPVVLAVYGGVDIIQKFIDIIGPTDPSKASKQSIRGKYGSDSLDAAISEGRPVSNVIHRSDSIEEAVREIAVWGQYLG